MFDIIKDDGTWEPAPSGYTTGNKDAWRNRMFDKCPNPEVGQIIIDYTMNGMLVGYKALDSRGYSTRWQRVAAPDQDAINLQRLEEYYENEYHHYVDELKNISPNPTAGEVCIVANTWDYPGNESASQFKAFQYSIGVWSEIDVTGRFMPITKSTEES